MNTPMPPSPFAGPPTAAHLQQIADAKRLSTKIRRAIGVAKFSGWTTAIFAAFTIAFSVTSFWGLVLGSAMAIISVVEFRGVGELSRLDVTAPKRLALNQLAFAALLFGYGAFMLWHRLNYAGDLVSEAMSQYGGLADLGDPELQKTFTDAARLAAIILYSSVMLAAILGPGLTALYYYTRRKYIEQYITHTPQWILDLQRAGMSL